jgi:drug/metabolite transporter (DMT)-like permease
VAQKKSTDTPRRGRTEGRGAAIALGVLALLWIVGYPVAKSDAVGVPGIKDIGPYTALGAWNYLIGALLLVGAVLLARREPKHGPNRWAAPLMIGSAAIGLLWIVVFYVTSGTEHTIPGYSDLGQWNLVIGMGFIVAAFGFATKWE